MKRLSVFGMVVMLVALILAGCVPAAAPALAPVPPQPAQAPVALSPEEVAWQKVVEAANKEGKLTAYSFNWYGDVGQAIAQAFKRRHGITLDILTGRGAEFVERLKTERRLGQMVGDVTETGSALVYNMKVEGLLGHVPEEIPSLREKEVWHLSPYAIDPKDKAVLLYTYSTYGPYINTKLVRPGEEPKQWSDLLQPIWKGKMVLDEPNLVTRPYALFVALMKRRVINEDYIRALYKQDLRFAISPLESITLIAKGERALTIIVGEASSGPLAAAGAPIKAIDMKDGIIVGGAGYGVVKDGPHPNAAKVFTHWLFSREGQDIQGKVKSILMLRKDMPDYRPEPLKYHVTTPVVVPPEEEEEVTKLFREKWFDKLVGRSR